jgi:hypothetical protein
VEGGKRIDNDGLCKVLMEQQVIKRFFFIGTMTAKCGGVMQNSIDRDIQRCTQKYIAELR